jgi:outer membrane lipoprotein-sorting protein
MLKLCLALPILLALLLSSCGGQTRDNAIDIRDFYTNAQELTLTALVQADFGDRTAEFRLAYQRGTDGAEVVTVTAPEEIAGITVTLTENGSRMMYDGLILETGALPGTGLSPVEAIPFAVKSWREGYITEQGKDTYNGATCQRLTHTVTRDGAAVIVTTWFESETAVPLKTEIFADGFLVLRCIFE